MFFSLKFYCYSKNLNSVENHVPAPIMRKTFFAEKDGEDFGVDVCGLGFYRVFVNGAEIGDAFGLSAYFNPDDYLFYDRYDLKKYIKKGKNALTFILGNGIINALDNNIWKFESAPWRSSPKVAFTLFKGEKIVADAEGVKCANSPVTFNDLRCGCRYDARKEIVGFADADFDDSAWETAIPADTPKGEPIARKAKGVRAIREIKADAPFLSPSGRYVYDFKENIAGVCKLEITATAGQIITLDHGEYLLGKELSVNNIDSYERSHVGYVQKDVYVAKDGKQTFIPSFTFHGFKYVAISGITDEQAKNLKITAIVTHPDFKTAGEFYCDNETINAVEDAVIRSNLSNMVLLPTDCPHREKNGWTGDAALSAEQFFYHHNAEEFLREWLKTVVKAQREDGALPGIVPSAGWGFSWGNGPGWDIVVPELAYRLYQASGDKSVYEDVYPSIIKYMDYILTKKNENGLYSYGLSDWCETGGMWGGDTLTPLEITDSCILINYYAIAERIFEVLGKTDDLSRAKARREELIAQFRKVHIKGNKVLPSTITGQAMAIFYGVFNGSERKDAEKVLRKMIEEDEYGMRVGVLGGRVLFETLAENGDEELAFSLIVKKEFPSYAYMLSRYDGGTLWEAFNETFEESSLGRQVRKDGERPLSFNHHFWGFVSTFFYKHLAGIRLSGVNGAVVSPKFVSGVNKVCATHEFKDGKVKVDILKNKNGASVKITADGGVNITFIYPAGFKRCGEEIKIISGVNEIELEKL